MSISSEHDHYWQDWDEPSTAELAAIDQLDPHNDQQQLEILSRLGQLALAAEPVVDQAQPARSALTVFGEIYGHDIDWQARAACLGLGLRAFFPARGGSITEARAICADCPVNQDCLDYARKYAISIGIWGGLSGRQRRSMLRASLTTNQPNLDRPALDGPGAPPKPL